MFFHRGYHIFTSNLIRFSSSTCNEISYINSLKTQKLNLVFDKSRTDKIACVLMNNKLNKNALSADFVQGMHRIFEDLNSDPDTKVVVLGSLVKNVFCAGADLKERAKIPDSDVPALVDGLRLLFHKLYKLPMPVIAAIDGAAIGGGLEMALACDMRYASDTPKTRIGLVETNLAIIPGAGGTQRLSRIIGVAKAKELIYRAELLRAREAFEHGIINAVVDSNDTNSKEHAALLYSLEVAREITTKGPIAIRMAKRAIQCGLEEDLEEGLFIEGQCYDIIVPTKDRHEGMKAFSEKRKPIYLGE